MRTLLAYVVLSFLIPSLAYQHPKTRNSNNRLLRMGLRSFISQKFKGGPPIPTEGLETLEKSVVWASEELVASEDGPKDLRELTQGSEDGEESAEYVWDIYQTETARLFDWPEDLQCQRRAADALCRWMRISTDGQTVTVDGPGDTPEFRRLWRKHAPDALRLYRDLMRNDKYMQALSDTSKADLLCNFIECQSSGASAKGVALAALSGDAVKFLANVKKLQTEHPDHCNGLGWIFESAFYIAAPRPLRSPKNALAAAEKALLVDPASRRNLYYAGLACTEIYGDLISSSSTKCHEEEAEIWRRQARIYLTGAISLSATAVSQSEKDIRDLLEREAKRALTSIGYVEEAAMLENEDGASWVTLIATDDEATAIISEGDQ